jgi:response regulator RpfG family c-di-GMP phosphodiesterase
MEAPSRPRVICVDDEPHVVSGLALHLRRRYDVEIATSGQAGLDLLARAPEAAVVISDMRMPGMNGAEFLSKVSAQHANTTRILLTGHTELDAAIRAVNEGNVFRFLLKPCPPPELLRAVEAAAEQHRLKSIESVLLEKTLHGSVKMLSELLAITNPLAFGRAARVKTIVSQLAEKLGEAQRWQVEVAAMLSQLASITLPNETAERLYYGAALTTAEQQMVERAPDVTQQLLGHIPRLEAVRDILARHTLPSTKQRMAGLGAEQRLIQRGAELLAVAVDYDALEAKGQTSSEAMVNLSLHPDKYEAEVLAALAEICHSRPQVDVVRELSVAALKPGMVFASDVKLVTGTLFVARGYEITAGFLERLKNLRPGSLKEPLRVIIRSEEQPS